MSFCGLVDVYRASVFLFIFSALCQSSLADEPMGEQRLSESIPGTQVVDLTSGLGSYIVRIDANPLKTGSRDAKRLVDETIARTNGAIRSQSIYLHSMVGFSAWMTEQEAADLARSPGIANVQPDRWMSLYDSSAEDMNPNEPDPWNLRRISEPDGLAPDYDPCGADGSGVTAVIIGTGIQTQQTLFAGRIREAISFAGSPGGEDTNGHETHVAGTVAGDHVGVAPACEIVSLRVAGDDGNLSDAAIIASLDWLADPANITVPAVVNMSLGGPAGAGVASMFYPINTLGSLGYVVVVASGNDGHPSDWTTPAAFFNVITVGATNIDDQPSGFSNYGSFTDILAPGVGILSAARKHPDGGLKFDSGTSMASPCVAGVAALFLERHVTQDQLESEPSVVSSRAHISMARSASNAIVDTTDPMLVSPGGNSALLGSANLLVQACSVDAGVACEDDVVWSGSTIPVFLGDGIERIPGELECVRTVRNTKGPVSLTVNTMAIYGVQDDPPNPSTQMSIEDVATGEVLWMSAPESWEDEDEIYRWSMDRRVTSSSRSGLRIIWESNESVDYTGYGYVMTANLAGSCPADLADDGQVGIQDLLKVLESWGVCQPGSACTADIDGDGMVGADDLLFVVNGWGVCEPFSPPGFIRDCNGNQVLKGFLGDGVLDSGQRYISPSPILDPDEIISVYLDCPEMNWDTQDGNNFTISPNDPRVGACAYPGLPGAPQDGSCIQTTMSECEDTGGWFWGRDVVCDDVSGFLNAEDSLCVDDSAYQSGWPVVYSYPLEEGYTTYRQLLEPGLFSISELRWIQFQPSSIARSKPNSPALSNSSIGRSISAEMIFGITIYYHDGGEPDFFLRSPDFEVVNQSSLSLLKSYRLTEPLVSGSREIHSIRIAAQPMGQQAQSSFFFSSRMMANLAAEGSVSPGSEKSIDGGRTWYPTADVGEQVIEMTLCVSP